MKWLWYFVGMLASLKTGFYWKLIENDALKEMLHRTLVVQRD